MTEKLLRGKAPLTLYRGADGGAGGYLYRGGILEASQVDPVDLDRLVEEGFLERVVRDGESFKLAEDTDTGSKGDPVTVGDAGLVPESELAKDPGPVNGAQQDAADKNAEQGRADAELHERRQAAQAKLPTDGSLPDGRAGKDVWVEFLAARGYSYEELVKEDLASLKAMAKQS